MNDLPRRIDNNDELLCKNYAEISSNINYIIKGVRTPPARRYLSVYFTYCGVTVRAEREGKGEKERERESATDERTGQAGFRLEGARARGPRPACQ